MHWQPPAPLVTRVTSLPTMADNEASDDAVEELVINKEYKI